MSHDEVKNPFPGLRPFEFGDNHLFFGRDQQTTELTTRLRKNRFVAVVGTSGSGKSSLVRAGLMPELLSGTMAGAGSSWETTVMRPGGDPLTNLAAAIVEADLYDSDEEDIASQVRATLTRSGLGLVEAMRQSELPEGTNFLLVVDQFEEIFRFRRSDDATDEQAAFFVNLLLEASAQADLPLYVIITMRSDFLGECSQFPRLADTVNEGEFLIPRLNRDQRKEAIVGPVKVAGGEIADRLLLRLLNDIGDDPDQLPILQHALMRTWDLFEERGGGGALDLEHYQATGGMGEALSRHADEVYGELSDAEHKRIAEKLFKSLTEKVDANRGIRRPMQLAELHEICGGEESHLREVLDAFRKTGCTFLMPAGEAEIKTKTVIDISHESLMRAWRSLRNWVDEEAQSAKIYRRLADTATLYHEDKAGLYRDPDLQISLSWREESRPNKTWANRYYPGFESAMAFLDQSQEEAEREEREREEARQREVAQAKALAKARTRTATIFKLACVGVTILMLVAVYASIVATKSKKLAEVKTIQVEEELIKQANRSYSISKSLKNEGKLDLSSAWLADAINLSKSDDALTRELLDEYLNDIIFSPKIKTILDCSNNVVDVKTDENSIYVLTDKEVEVFELSSHQKTVLPFNNTSSLYSQITDDLRYVIHFDDYNTVGAWDLTNNSTSGSYSLPPSLRFLLNKYVYHSNLGVVVVPFRGSQNGFLVYDLNKNITQIVHSKSSIDNIGFLDNSLFTSYYDYKNKTTTINQWEGLSLGLNIKSKNQYFVTGRVKGLLFPPPGTTNEIVVISKPKSTSPVIQVGKIQDNIFQAVNSLSFNNGLRNPSLSKDGRIIYFLDDNNKLNKAAFDGEVTFADAEGEYANYIISPDNALILGVSKQNDITLISSTNADQPKKTIVLSDADSKVVFDKSCQEFVLYNTGNKICVVNIPLYYDIDDVSFPGRFSPVELEINSPKPFKKYKLIFTELNTPGIEAFQLAEINFHDSDGVSILSPNDHIEVTKDHNSPLGEEITKIIDGKLNTKHLNFNTVNPGFTILPSKNKILSRITLYSANDLPGRDPSKYRLEGSVDGVSFELISEGDIVANDYLKSKDSLHEKLRENILTNNRDYFSTMSAMSTGCRISQNGKVDLLNFDEIHEMFEKNANGHIAAYLKNLSRGNSDWHMITLLKNSMDYFDQDSGNPFTVLYHYNDLSDSDRMHSNLFYLKGLSHFILGEMVESEKAFESQIALNNNDLQALYELAIIHVYNMNYDKALSAIDTAISQNVLDSNIFWGSRFTGLYLNIPKKLKNESHTKVLDFLKLDEAQIQETTVNPYVEIPLNSLLDFEEGITIQAWVKPQGNQIFGRLVNKGGDWRQDGYSVNYYWGQLFFELYNSSTAEHGWLRYNINITDWTRFTATWDIKDATMKLYINGKLVSNEIEFEGPIGLTQQNLNFGRSSSSASYSNAQISNVYLWDYSLNDSEIKNSFMQSQNSLEKTAVGVWKFAPDAAEVLNCSNNSDLNGKIYNTEIKTSEVTHSLIKKLHSIHDGFCAIKPK